MHVVRPTQIVLSGGRLWSCKAMFDFINKKTHDFHNISCSRLHQYHFSYIHTLVIIKNLRPDSWSI